MAAERARPTTERDHRSLALAIAAFGDALIAKSPRTATNYRSALNRFLEFLPSMGLDPAGATTDALPADSIERFYTWLLRTYGRDHKASAVTYVAGVRAFFRFLDRQGSLAQGVSFERMNDGVRELIGRTRYKTPRADDGVARVVTTAMAAPLPPALREHEQARLEALRDRAILATLYCTGMRRAELAGLNRADIRDGRASEGIITGKGDRERTIFFDEPALAAIRAYLDERRDTLAPVFLRHDDGRGQPGPRGEHWRLSPQSVWNVVKRYGRLARVDVSPHKLRHLKARVLLNAGAHLAEVQDILGHASPETTKRIYAQYTKQHLREVFDQFSVPAEDLVRGAVGPTRALLRGGE